MMVTNLRNNCISTVEDTHQKCVMISREMRNVSFFEKKKSDYLQISGIEKSKLLHD